MNESPIPGAQRAAEPGEGPVGAGAPPDPATARRLRHLGTTLVALAAFWMVAGGAVLWTSMPTVAVDRLDRPPGSGGHVLRQVVPEGWAFFTKSPRSARQRLFVRRGERWEPTGAGGARAIGGLSRAPRAQGVELGLLLADVGPDAWAECEGDSVEACLDATAPAEPVANVLPSPTLCGTLGIVSQKPVPWAWRSMADRVDMPSSTLRLEVTCDA